MESDSEVGISKFKVSKIRCHAQYEQPRRFFICLRSALPLVDPRTAHPDFLRDYFLTSVSGSSCLMVLGAVPTIVGAPWRSANRIWS